MDFNRVVDILFEDSGSYGSGYLITRDLVLTAKHVADPCSVKAECRVTPLHWNGQGARRSQHSRKANVIWLSEELDAALLQLMPEQEIPHLPMQPVLLGHVPDDAKRQHWRCESIGFPAALDLKAGNADRRLQGTLSWVTRLKRHHIDVLNATPEKAVLWRGFSGASVFVGDYLVGVVRTVEKNFNGRVLQATPVSILFQDETFRKHLSQDELKACEPALPTRESEHTLLPHPAEFRSLDEFQDVLDALSRLSLNERHRELKADHQQCTRQSEYYTRLAHPSGPQAECPDLRTLALRVLECQDPFPLNLFGHHGSGRSSMLSALFVPLRELCIKRDIPVLYIDLTAYLPSEHVGSLASPPRHIGGPNYDSDHRTQMLVTQLQRAAYTFRDREVVVVLAGVDEDLYASWLPHRQRRGEIIDALMKLPRLKMVIGSLRRASTQAALNRRWPSELHNHYSIPALTYELNWVERFTDKYSEIVDAYCQMENFDRPEQVKATIDEFKISHVDTYVLSQLVRHMRTGALNGHSSSASFLEVYVDKRLRAELKDLYKVDAIDLASKRAFKSLTGAVSPASTAFDAAMARVLHEHITVRDFLAARFMVDLLGQDLRSKPKPDYLVGIGHVFSNAINLFVIDILNSNTQLQDRILANAEAIYKHSLGRLTEIEEGTADAILGFITLCYAIGRLHKDQTTVERAKTVLKKLKAFVKQLRHDHQWWRADQSALLLFRTICISLSYLGDEDTTREYIDVLLSTPAEDNLNRGFYLEYYGDLVPQSPYRLHAYSDPLTDFSKTFRWIRAQIDKQLEARAEHGRHDARSLIIDVSIQTLLSLVQHRHASGKLRPQDRSETSALITLLCGSYLREDSNLRSFARLVGTNLSLPDFPAGIIAAELAKLKSIERCHWTFEKKPEAATNRVESVAEHIAGACLLALLYIRDGSFEGGVPIDKSKLIMTLLVHDIVEAYTGDLGTKSDRNRAFDRDLMTYMSLLQTYGEVGSTSEILELYDDWGERRTPEGRIARDIDKLDALLQLHRYRSSIPEENFQALYSEFTSDIRTEAGKRIRQVIERYFSVSNGAHHPRQRDLATDFQQLGWASRGHEFEEQKADRPIVEGLETFPKKRRGGMHPEGGHVGDPAPTRTP